jgi:long-chain acyl-CoA synthetase
LVAYCRQRLAAFKCPRSIDFTEKLPRLETGKILRRVVREKYWKGRERRI